MHAARPARPLTPPLPRAALAALALAACTGAHAASFDCKAARSPAEKAICGSPKLSALDDRMAQDYARAVHALSPAGAAQLKDSQRNWLRFAARVCVPRAAKGGGEPPAECLSREYERRLGQLAQAGVRIGPYVFNRVDYHSAVRVGLHDDGAGNYPGFVTEHVAFAQIDAPLTTVTIAWNAAQRVEPPSPDTGDDRVAETTDDDPASDNDVDFELGCVGPRFISLSKKTAYFVHGSAHGGYDHEVHDVVFAPAMRKMTAGDVFGANSGWKTRLPGLFWNVYTQGREATDDLPSIKEAIQASAANPERWLLTPAGLQISFDADEAGCYACNPGPLTVPWATLKPMLASPDIAACKAPPAARP
jgi:uncharacterized protein